MQPISVPLLSKAIIVERSIFPRLLSAMGSSITSRLWPRRLLITARGCFRLRFPIVLGLLAHRLSKVAGRFGMWSLAIRFLLLVQQLLPTVPRCAQLRCPSILRASRPLFSMAVQRSKRWQWVAALMLSMNMLSAAVRRLNL